MEYDKKSIENEKEENIDKLINEVVEKTEKEEKEVKKIKLSKNRFNFLRIFLIITIPIIIIEIIIISKLPIKGSPKNEILIKTSDKISNPINELVMYNNFIRRYKKEKGKFPEDLKKISDEYSITQPEYITYSTDKKYGYILQLKNDSLKAPVFTGKGIEIKNNIFKKEEK
ncbi:MAG: hypothetical protein QME48_04870 [bacterium]|uniref:Uncharacterized protein n=2 Tax=Bacteria candidate phyla TaxID=1783234 RepID=A0A117M706_UNCT6|nr:MAG: hypothetical protein XD76_0739 [candidate division TA06 bacterium 32_111]KUK87925.1 MAG: hypothetical protein XE03_0444 [candidate division TA06 bacterium 34_109]MDI6700546.1 hypothetical protein [bacterium]HAF08078.1 hypothetical protein [candidate division WOR-3 bacterium]HCP16221.1 hypothetical protein [candidate division WOR-3 bacterium]